MNNIRLVCRRLLPARVNTGCVVSGVPSSFLFHHRMCNAKIQTMHSVLSGESNTISQNEGYSSFSKNEIDVADGNDEPVSDDRDSARQSVDLVTVDSKETNVNVSQSFHETATKLLSELSIQASNLDTIKPSLPTQSWNLAAYVNQSETLTNLVQIGMDLSKAEKLPKIASRLVKMDFEMEVKPYLLFLKSTGVQDENLGKCLTKCPVLFLEDLDDLEVRIQYFLSKKFTTTAISRMVTLAPQLLTRSTKEIDSQLGYLQKEFGLSGDNIRFLVTRQPAILTWNQQVIKMNKVTLKGFLGFNDDQLKRLLLSLPKLYNIEDHHLRERFDYAFHDMGLTRENIVNCPSILNTRLFIMKQRHKFLQHLSRDQLDPTKPNFVSVKALVSGNDEKFCHNVAKVPLDQFNDFLRSL